MKCIISKIPKLALLVPLLLTLFISGCSTSTGGSGSPGGSGGGRTFKQVDLDLSGPMTRYRNAVASGVGVTEGEKEQINSLYARYQAAYREALQAAGNNRDAPAPKNVDDLATQVLGALQALP